MSITSSPILIRSNFISNDGFENGSEPRSITPSSTSTVSGGLPTSDISLAWRNLRYQVRRFPFSKPKVLLERLNGSVEYRSLNGFLGPSGAGKTTLLNCLNGNLYNGLTRDSEIYINKFERQTPKIAFVEQHVHETILPRLTVREIMRFAFLFKNGWQNRNRMSSHIDSVMSELMLEPDLLDRAFDKCSGGQQKRIAIAQELMSLTQPSFLFVDEPTTGLDSNSALVVMQCLRKLADSYRMTITVSIHVPSSEIVDLFDQLYILARGGVCIYSGPPNQLETYLENNLHIGLLDERPPIEQYMKIACKGLEHQDVCRLAEETLEKEHKKLSQQIICLDFVRYGVPRRPKPFLIHDFLLQLYRMFRLVFVVNWHIVFFQVLLYFFALAPMALLFGWEMMSPSGCYSISGNNQTCEQQLQDDDLIQIYVNYQSMCVMTVGFGMIAISSVVFAPFLKIFRNEHQNGWYSMGTFFFSYTFVRFIEMNLFVILSVAVIYFSSGHHNLDNELNWNRLGYFFIPYWLYCFYLQSFGQLVSLIFLNEFEISIITSYIFYISICLLNGYMIPLEHTNNWVILKIAKILCSNVVSKAMLWSVYGFERCDPNTSMSVILNKFSVNPETVHDDLFPVASNSAILRIATLIIMFARFSISWRFTPLSSNRTIKRISFPVSVKIPLPATPIPKRNKRNSEIECENYCRDKIILAWRSLSLFGSCSIFELRPVKDIKENPKMILRNLNGQFQFGTMNALMGTSGAGKTSLLKALSGRRKTYLSTESKIYLSQFTPTRICYITQEVSGHLLPGLTVKQSLIYASRMKNATEETQIDHEQVAMWLLNELDIAQAADTLIQKCSGGERKRLAVALELTSLRMPNLVYIDEPTSGLDSNSAETVISCLRTFVHRHKITIVASIHQPHTDLINMFDELYVLARGGVCIYFGPPDHIRQHLSKVLGAKAAKGRFPVEELMKYSCLDHQNPIVKELVRATNEKIYASDEKLKQETRLVADGIPLNRVRFSLESWRTLFLRYLRFVRGHLWHRWIFFTAIYLIYAGLLRYIFDSRMVLTDGCISLEDDFISEACHRTAETIEKENNLTDNNRYNFYGFNVFSLLVLFQCGLGFKRESIIFFNEHRNGWYSAGVFFLTKTICDSVFMFPIIAVYVWILDIYEVIRPGIYWWMLLLLFLGIQAFQSLSQFFSLLTGRDTLGFISIANLAYTVMLMTANVYIRISSLHYVLQLISQFSICRFITEGLMILQYGFGRCQPKQIQSVLYMMEIPGDHHFKYCIQMLIFHTILYRVLGLATLIIKSNPVENRRRRAQRILKYQEQMKTSNAIIPGLSSDLEFRIRIVSYK